MGWIRRTAVLGVGYLLGARAGRARYDQILDTVRRVADRPELTPYLAPAGRLLDPAPTSATPARPAVPDNSPAATPPREPATGTLESVPAGGADLPGPPVAALVSASTLPTELPAPPADPPPVVPAAKRPRSRTRRVTLPAGPNDTTPTAPTEPPDPPTAAAKRPRSRPRRTIPPTPPAA